MESVSGALIALQQELEELKVSPKGRGQILGAESVRSIFKDRYKRVKLLPTTYYLPPYHELAAVALSAVQGIDPRIQL